MIYLAARRKPSPHENQVTPRDARLCSNLKDVLPLTPAVLLCSLLTTFVQKQIALSAEAGWLRGGGAGNVELSCRSILGVRKSVSELLTPSDRSN